MEKVASFILANDSRLLHSQIINNVYDKRLYHVCLVELPVKTRQDNKAHTIARLMSESQACLRARVRREE